eukprot:5206114-Lingulodinium_polyedra.AAC.1
MGFRLRVALTVRFHNLGASRRTPEAAVKLRQKQHRNHRIQRNVMRVIVELLRTQPGATVILEQPKGCRSLGAAGEF